ncbi:2-hydroxy-3-keto-5-methylthiopentenyl-1-phosphate phosphatase [Bacillus sp. CGMCC 1.16607]|uniref:2-hydroxy-3-keto-5-methylthiopentenyl-1- phosphate phosphatase n=1 Tax=Bacillus sp. CGMCC 1.16607 TaxID=3351842 RepID=UPI0036258A08
MIKPVIYCDFDGTITEKDNIIAIMNEFAPPEWEPIKNDILSQKISIEEGVGKMFALLPSTLKDEIVQFSLKHAVIREGFNELLQLTKGENIPFYVVSGGIDFFVHPILEQVGFIGNIYCNSADFSKQNIQIRWPNPCDQNCQNGCGCCKPSIIRKLKSENEFTIVIGDSITDLEAAKQADFVFARDFLAEKCEQLKIKHKKFNTFYDCFDSIKELTRGELANVT